MRFSSPLYLFLFLIIPVIIFIGWPSRGESRRREMISLFFRLIIVTTLILALAGLELAQSDFANPISVVFLIDASDSMSAAAKTETVQFTKQALQRMGADDQAAIIVFGGDALVERQMSNSRDFSGYTSLPVTSATNLAKAIQLGLALFPPNLARRMVLLSDGVSTTGNPISIARVTGNSKVELLIGALTQRNQPVHSEIMVSSLQLPTRLRQGDRFDLNINIEATALITATIALYVNGNPEYIGTEAINPGFQTFRLPLIAKSPGFAEYKIQISTSTNADGYYQNNQLSTYTQIAGIPRILLVAPESGEKLPGGGIRPDEASLLYNILANLPDSEGKMGFLVDQIRPYDMPGELSRLANYAAVILVDTPASQLTPSQMENLGLYVGELGGGLVVIGGPTSYGVGGYYRTELEKILPVEMQIKDEQRRPSLSLVFIIDRSGSMADLSGGASKLDLAKEAVIRSLDLLSPGDKVGVIAFDEQASWIINPTTIENPERIKNLVASLQPGGGTDIFAAVQAMAKVLPADAAVNKHVILLTDGGADPTNIPELVKNLYEKDGITLTTIGVGRDAAPFLPELAKLGGGRYHFAATPSQIPQIYAEETALATRAYIVEEPFYPQIISKSQLIESLGLLSTPRLFGYVATTAKPESQVLLQSLQEDPILAIWNYGLGKTAAFTSDATSRWAQEWLIDPQTRQVRPEFAIFWQSLVRNMIGDPSLSPLEITIQSKEGGAEILADAVNQSDPVSNLPAFLNSYTMQAVILDPKGEKQSIELIQVAPGRYKGEFQTSQTGAYLFQINGEPPSSALPKVSESYGWVLAYSAEYRQLNPDPDALMRLAAAADTQRYPFVNSDQVFIHDLPSQGSLQPAWPWLITVAACLLPFDIAIRRLLVTRSDITHTFDALTNKINPLKERQLNQHDQRLERLLQAKDRISHQKQVQTEQENNKFPSPASTNVVESQNLHSAQISDLQLGDSDKTSEDLPPVKQLLKSKRERKK